jgi:hypothetical protein
VILFLFWKCVCNIFLQCLLIYHLFNHIIGHMLLVFILYQYLLEYDLCRRKCVMIRTRISTVVQKATLRAGPTHEANWCLPRVAEFWRKRKQDYSTSMTTFHKTGKEVSYCDYFILYMQSQEMKLIVQGEGWAKCNLHQGWQKTLRQSWLHWKI